MAFTGITVHDIRARLTDMFQGFGHLPLRGMLGAVNVTVERILGYQGLWSFMYAQGSITLVDDYVTGTCDVTNGDATVSGNSTVWTAAMDGRKMRISGVEYEISSRTSDTELELTQNYIGDTDTAVSYAIYQDEYNVASDVKQILRVWDVTNERTLQAASALDLRSKTLESTSGAQVREYAQIGTASSSSNVIRLLFYPYPVDDAYLEYWYERTHTEVTGPASAVDLPTEMDELVVQGVFAYYLRMPQFRELFRDAATREWAVFQKMLEEYWSRDKPLRDFAAKLARWDRAEPGLPYGGRPPDRIPAS